MLRLLHTSVVGYSFLGQVEGTRKSGKVVGHPKDWYKEGEDRSSDCCTDVIILFIGTEVTEWYGKMKSEVQNNNSCRWY